MADLHALPLLGHDLPEPLAPEKVKVFKHGDHWAWTHPLCRGLYTFSTGPYCHASHQQAMRAALKHLKWCRQ